MDLNKLRYSKTVAVKDMEVHSDKTEKAAVSEKDKSLSVGKMSSDYLKGEATIETKIVFIISGGDKREKDYFKMLMKDRHIRRLKIAFVSKKGQGLVPSQMFELAKEYLFNKRFVTETDSFSIDADDTLYLVQDMDEFEVDIRTMFDKGDEIRQATWIVSNPSIEVWLFYHKFDTPKGYLDEGLKKPLSERSQWLKKKLDALVPGGINPINAFADIRIAIANSKANYKEYNGLPDVYSTQMHILAEDILNTLGNEFDEMLQRRKEMAERFMRSEI